MARKQTAAPAAATQKYAQAQHERGLVLVKAWVPEAMGTWLNNAAAEARMLHKQGLDPMTRLPSTLLAVEVKA